MYNSEAFSNVIFESKIFKRPLNNKVIFKVKYGNKVIFSKTIDLNKIDVKTDIGTNIVKRIKLNIKGRIINKDKQPIKDILVAENTQFKFNKTYTDKNGYFNLILFPKDINKIEISIFCADFLYVPKIFKYNISNNKSVLDIGTIKFNQTSTQVCHLDITM